MAFEMLSLISALLSSFLVVSQKRSAPISFTKIAFYQETKWDKPFKATSQGLCSLKESADEKQKLHDVENADQADRISVKSEEIQDKMPV